MFRQFARLVSLLALLVFGYAQYQGWNLFQDEANAGRGSGSSGGRSYHK